MRRVALIGAGTFLVCSSAIGGLGRWTTNWTAPTARVSSVVADPQREQTLYAGANVVFKTDDAGGSWQPCGDGPTQVTALATDPSTTGILYAGNSAGTLFQSTAGCEHWNVLFQRNTGVMTPPPVRLIVIHPADPRILFLQHASSIRLPGDLLRSDDGGATWEGVALTEPVSHFVTALTFDPRNLQVLYAGTEENEGFYRSSNGGASWMQIQNEISRSRVTSLVLDPATETIYAGLIPFLPLTGSLWKSIDGGLSFSFSGAGLPTTGVDDVVIDPRRSDVSYVGTETEGVFVTRDGGKTWTTLNDGLGSLTVRKLAIDIFGRTLHTATDAGVFDFEFLPERPSVLPPPPRHGPATVSR